MTSLEGDNLAVFYYFSALEIWPDNRVGLQWKGTTMFINYNFNNFFVVYVNVDKNEIAAT